MRVLPLMTIVLAGFEVLDTGGLEICGTETTEVIAFPDASGYTAVYVVHAAGNAVIRVPMRSQFGGAGVACMLCMLHPLEVYGHLGIVGVVLASKDSVTTTVSSALLTPGSSDLLREPRTNQDVYLRLCRCNFAYSG